MTPRRKVEKRTFGEKLKMFREQQGLSLTELEDRSQVSKSLISRLESNKANNPSLHTIEALAAALSVEPAEFLSDSQKDLVSVRTEYADLLVMTEVQELLQELLTLSPSGQKAFVRSTIELTRSLRESAITRRRNLFKKPGEPE